MPTKTTKILAIDPGTREIGVAVLQGEELLYYGVKTIRTRRTPREVLRMAAWTVRRLIADYQPEILAIEKTFLIQKSASLLTVVAEEMKATARREGLAVYEYAPAFVRKFLCQTGKATKKEVARRIAARYRELARYLDQRSRWRELYWGKMFDAIAVGLACTQEVARNQSSAEGERSRG